MSKETTRRVRAARSRYVIVLVLTAAIAVSAGSRIRLSATGNATVYGELTAQDTVFAGTLQTATITGGTLATPASAKRFAKGQLARVYLDCAALSTLAPGTPGADLCGAD